MTDEPENERDSRRAPRKPKAAPARTSASGSDRAGSDDRGGPSPWGLLLVVAIAAALLTGHWTLVVAILGLALLIFVHELGHFLAAKAFHMRVEKFYIGFPPAVIRHTRGETEYGVGAIPLGGFCKISGMTPDEELPDEVVPRAYYSKPVWQRNIAIAAGPLMNVVAAVVILFVFFQAAGVPKPTLTVGQIVKGTPAAASGLRAGDRLVAADGVRFTTWTQATSFFADHPKKTVTVTYRTPQGRLESTRVTLTTRPDAPSEGFLGVGPKTNTVYLPPWRAAWLALVGNPNEGAGIPGAAYIVGETFRGFWLLVTGKISATGPEGATGPVGIISVSQHVVRLDWLLYLPLLAFISINLAIINLLPFLPFDGGHIFFNVVERLRGRRTDPRVLERAIAVGVVLLITLAVLLTYNDIQRLFS